MPDNRKTGKNALLAAAYGGSKTGRFGANMHDYWKQAQRRLYRPVPPQYTGVPHFCIKCTKPCVSYAIGGDNRCKCHHLKRVKETKQAAMERRAHWLLKKEFDPDPVVIRDWKTSYERVGMLPPSPAHPYKVDFAELEKRWRDLNDKMTDELIYGVNATTSNKEKP